MNKKKSLALFAPALLSSLIFSQFAQSHGWVEFPSARQNTCYNDGGLWNDSIPNAACQAAYDVSGYYPFVQRNEIAANVIDYTNMDAVKAVVTDGTLCAAGDSAKAGLDVTSDDWQKTTIDLDGNNQFELVFTATAAHNPSYWEFYLTNESYDFSSPLTWNDLTLIDTEDDLSVNSNNEYVMTVTIPSGRSGDAILYTRWQRDDPAGEGFYNCSDITISGGSSDSGSDNSADDGSSDQGSVSDDNGNEVDADLTDIGYFVSTDFAEVETGDSLRLRIFSSSGSEAIDMSYAITDDNLDNWAESLATTFNEGQEGKWYIGVWRENQGQYNFNSNNIYANKVYAPSTDYSYQLSLVKATDDPSSDTSDSTDTWNSTSVYTEGDAVTYSTCTWNAQWWTQGDEPGTTGEYGVWRTTDETCDTTSDSDSSSENSDSDGSTDESSNSSANTSTSYIADTVYIKDETVTYQGCTYTAQWWTQGEEPGTTGEWGVWRTTDENCSN